MNNLEMEDIDFTEPEKNPGYNSELEEYKLATQIHRHYYDLTVKTITVYLAITGVSLGFVFRENVSITLKVLFCWFNFIVSLAFCLAYTGFYVITKRLAKHMKQLTKILGFGLSHHRGLPYGIFIALICAIGVLIFWTMTLILRFWDAPLPLSASLNT
jgi:hypothetical protein